MLMDKTCTKCGDTKPISEFGKDAQKRDGFRPLCKTCNRKTAKLWEIQNKEKRTEQKKAWKSANRAQINKVNFDWRKSESGRISELLALARRRAKQVDVPFALTPADIQIPEQCPVFGRPFAQKRGKGPSPWSMTLDRIIPSKGYVPGNVQVLSHRANVMKNAASPEELVLFASWITKTFTGDLT